MLRCFLRCWGSSSQTRPRSVGRAARRRGVLPAERDGVRQHVEAEVEAARIFAAVEAEEGLEAAWMIAVATMAEEEDAEAQPAREQPHPEAGTDDETERLIASLPLITMASPQAALIKNSPDCTVCLMPFDAETELRLLPACRHAFHADCIDTWLRTNLVCPICRLDVSFPLPPLPLVEEVAAPSPAQEEFDAQPPAVGAKGFCAVCFKPTALRCKQCKAVKYCSDKCQIAHWRQGHKYDCHPPSATKNSPD